MLQKRVNLFGLLVDDVDIGAALLLVEDCFESGKARAFFTPNLEMLSGACKSEGIQKMLNSADVSLPDGFGLRLVARLIGAPLGNTVAGIDFGQGLLSVADLRGRGVFLLGGREGVAERAAARLCEAHNGLRICGTHHGYFRDEEIPSVSEKINLSGAEVLIVCRGFPRQEKFVFAARDTLTEIKVFACLGGSLDVWAGDVERAPLIIRKIHLEWLWRIMHEPERLSRFISSLDVLFKGMVLLFKRIIRFGGMNTRGAEYN